LNINFRKQRIAYVVNHAAFFISHRALLAEACIKEGYDVCLFIGQGASNSMEDSAEIALKKLCIPYVRGKFKSSSLNLFTEFFALIKLILAIRGFCPDLIHCASPKGVLYGGIASRICRTRALVLAVTGMGYSFTEDGKKNIRRQLSRIIYMSVAKYVFSHPNLKIIVQNNDDYLYLKRNGLSNHSKITIIKGVGVDLDALRVDKLTQKEKIILFPARVIKDKGVTEFVTAAMMLEDKFKNWQFIIAGALDYDNPSSIHLDEIYKWSLLNNIQLLGHIEDMTTLFKRSAIVCLPSYREGMPKALMEAAAAGCAVVTTDVIGCREAIVPNLTGILVPPRDSEALAIALTELMSNWQKCTELGINGQKYASMNFSSNKIINNTINLYKELLDEKSP
jgi:glycosyltransferase involved in cell wall biosynthesis